MAPGIVELSRSLITRPDRLHDEHRSGTISVNLGAIGVRYPSGALGAEAGRADIGRGVIRLVFWGALAMAITAWIGRLFGTVV